MPIFLPAPLRRLVPKALFCALLLCLPLPALADTWAVYWYLCGSDLERKYGGATLDLKEACEATLGDNVKVIVQTGGTRQWQNELVSSKKLERYVIDKDDITCVEQLPQASMGKRATLASFLRFCRDKYPADHAMLIIWDHGGGSARELANDENFDDDGLTLRELRQALEDVWQPDAQHPPLEIIGFDACLMATLDVANTVYGFARAMVASQDVEPGNGWEYTGFLTALARRTTLSPTALGRHICDTYMQGCHEAETDGSATLSVLDLSRLPELNRAWNLLGLEAALTLRRDRRIYAELARHARTAEGYANTRGGTMSNMVDMGSYVSQLRAVLPQHAEQLLQALDAAIMYRVNGAYRKSSGLSCYCPLDGGKTWSAMRKNGFHSAFLVLQGLQLGKMDTETARRELHALAAACGVEPSRPEGVPTPPMPTSPPVAEEGGPLSGLQRLLAQGTSSVVATLKPLEALDSSRLEDTPITVDANGDATLTLGPEKAQFLQAVYGCLAYYSKEDDIIVILGKDADIKADWDKGVFRDNFRNVWPALDGHLVSMEITQMDESWYRYAVPVKCNGERVDLEVIYTFADENYKILGARKVGASGLVDKFLYKLKAGDTLVTLFTAMTISADEDDSQEVEVDTFTLKADSHIEDTDMGDGTFIYLFEMEDVQGNSALSQVASVEVKDGRITMSQVEDDD